MPPLYISQVHSFDFLEATYDTYQSNPTVHVDHFPHSHEHAPHTNTNLFPKQSQAQYSPPLEDSHDPSKIE